VSDPRPIGVFDSGVGGLTVAAALARRLPGERIVYLGDTARLPYGTKSPATVARYTQANVDFLVGRGVKAVVVACNTASALALDRLETALPVWGGIEPGAARAAAASRGRVGVIATEATVQSDAYGRALARLRPSLVVLSRACPLFVPLVEEGWFEHPAAELIAADYLAPLQQAGIDVLVLGCTHYPLLRPLLQRVMGPGVRLIDSGEATAEALAATLRAEGLEALPGGEVFHRFAVSDDEARFRQVGSRFIGDRLGAAEVVGVG